MFQIGGTGYAEMMAELEAALSWLESMGVRARNSRYETYLRTIRRIDERWREGATTAKDIPVDAVLMETAFREGLQLIRIAKGLRSQDGGHIQVKLACLIDGPILEGDEKSANSGTRGRNHGFELEVAAYLAAVGDIELAAGVDVVVRNSAIPFFIECKRPSSLKKLAAALDDAGSQIARQLVHTNLIGYGIVAISVAKMHWPAGALIHGASFEAVGASLRAWVDRFDRRYVTPWLRRQRDGRMAAVLVHFPYVAYAGDSPTVAGTEFYLLGRYQPGTHSYKDLRDLVSAAERGRPA